MQMSLSNPRRTVEQILADESIRLRNQARAMPPGVERDRLIRIARQAETGSHLSDGCNLPASSCPAEKCLR